MGRDKATLNVLGKSLAARAADILAAVCSEVAVADRGRRLLPGLPSLRDAPEASGEGPASGILGAARTYPGRSLLVLACDLPWVPSALLASLADSPGCDWAVPRWADHLEPLCAFYGPAALRALAQRVLRGWLALHGLAEEKALAVRFLEGEALAAYGRPEEMFFNLNTPEDLERLGS